MASSTKREALLDLGLLGLRVLLGAGLAYHGFGQVFGGDVAGLAEGVTKLGLPYPVHSAWLAALSEFVGGILLVFGLGTRVAAFFIFITMSVAAFLAHAHDPFAVKELALAYWAMAGTLVMTGPGGTSVDALLAQRFRRRGAGPAAKRA